MVGQDRKRGVEGLSLVGQEEVPCGFGNWGWGRGEGPPWEERLLELVSGVGKKREPFSQMWLWS